MFPFLVSGKFSMYSGTQTYLGDSIGTMITQLIAGNLCAYTNKRPLGNKVSLALSGHEQFSL